MPHLHRLLTSPECSSFTHDPQVISLTKFAITHGCYVMLNAILLVPKLTGHHRALHSTNAMIAIWTLSLGPLVKSCVSARKKGQTHMIPVEQITEMMMKC